ncbi:LysR family transcriptional regulator (chromosome initiation inhibitor) [Oxalobacteraceae bacterium GrIS 2.11]
MKIDNGQLAAFAAVLREGNFELAARKLNVTPSAVSQRIKALEDRIGQILIQRSNPCQATAAGRIVLRYAEQLALLESEVFMALGIDHALPSTRVRIPVVINADSLDSWFALVLQSIADDGSIALDVRAEDQDHSLAMLREGNVMAGLSTSADPIQGCRVTALGVMRYVAVASPAYIEKHFSKGLSAEALNSAPVLTFNRKDALQKMFIALLTDQPVDPPIHFMPSTRSFLEAARCGLAWGVMPEHIAADALQLGAVRQLSEAHWLDIPLYWHRWRIESSSLDLISKFVYAAASVKLRKTAD